jgi:uncharacterized protein
MIEVEISSIRVSLMNQQRIVVLKDIHSDRFLAIFIGQYEAEAINFELQETTAPHPRPLTHDLLKNMIQEMGGNVVHVLVNDLRDETFYARIVIDLGGDNQIEVDARPSDAIALAVRTKSPIFIAEAVMNRAALEPEEDVEINDDDMPEPDVELDERKPAEDVDESRFSAFADFVNSLDLDELDDDDK